MMPLPPDSQELVKIISELVAGLAQKWEAFVTALQQPNSPGAPSWPPYRSQWDEDGNMRNSDCGPTCVAMLLEQRGQIVPINQLAREAAMDTHPTYTLPQDLINCAAAHGLPVARALGLTIDRLRAETLVGRPVIVLVHYGTLHGLPTQDRKFSAGHWLVVVAIDDRSVIVHDPNWRGTERAKGAGLAIPIKLFEQAMEDCRIDRNTARQGLIIVS